MLSPSSLVLKALKVSPQGTPYLGEHISTCSMCGQDIKPGDLHTPMKAGEFFSDTRDLAAFSGVVCGACTVIRSKVALNGLSYTVTTRDAVYQIAKDDHKAWLLLTPPEPPFVAVLSSTTMMHLIWRTPVTLSKELITLRYGLRLLKIRPAVLHQLQGVASQIQQQRLEAGDTKARLNPFLKVDRDLRDPDHGRIHPKALQVMSASDRDFLLSLTVGEVWASSILLKATPPTPTHPEPKTITI